MKAVSDQKVGDQHVHASAKPYAASKSEAGPAGRYLVSAGWGHIFYGRRKEITRWIYDCAEETLVAAQILGDNAVWQDLDPAAMADLLEDIGDNEATDRPEHWGLISFAWLPPWSAVARLMLNEDAHVESSASIGGLDMSALASVIDCAQSNIDDIDSGLDDGSYLQSENADLPAKRRALDILSAWHKSRLNMMTQPGMGSGFYVPAVQSNLASKYFEITAAGFDASSHASSNEEQVFWVRVDSQEALELVSEVVKDTGAILRTELPSDFSGEVDFVLPAQSLGLASALLQKASDLRNRNRAVRSDRG